MGVERKNRGRNAVKMTAQGAAAANSGPLGTLMHDKEDWD
jgi:hypothetical protein